MKKNEKKDLDHMIEGKNSTIRELKKRIKKLEEDLSNSEEDCDSCMVQREDLREERDKLRITLKGIREIISGALL